MRPIKILLLAFITAFALGLTTRSSSANAQAQIPACTDKTNFGTILSAMSQGPFTDAMGNLASAATPDDFANIIDLGIQAKHVIGDLSINPGTDMGCFAFQLTAFGVLDDEINVVTYQSFIKAGLKNTDAYTKGLTDSQTRLQKDLATWQALAKASMPAATTTP